MIGFDRPLKPIWIYQFIQLVEEGQKISSYKDEFNEILWELDGEEGKRKVRTVLSRYFLKSENNSRKNIVERLTIIDICKQFPLEEIKPLLLFHLLMRSNMLRAITMLIYELYGSKESINYLFLKKKIIEKFGDRDISGRTLRNFLDTLKAFDILKNDKRNLIWNTQLEINEMSLCYMLYFYAHIYQKSPHIVLENIEDYLFFYFQIPDIVKILKKYHGKLWEYSVRINQRTILIDEAKYDWNVEHIYSLFHGSKN